MADVGGWVRRAHRRGLQLEGQLQQVAVAAAALGREGLAAVVLDDAAVVEDDHLVDHPQRRQLVGDDQRRPAGQQLGDGRLQPGLRVGVDACRGLVQHDEVGPAQPDPRQGQQLGLACRQPGAGGSELRWMPPATRASRPTRRRAPSTSASDGSGSNSATLSRTVPWNSSTSWGTSDAAAQLGHRDVGDRDAAELDDAARRFDEAQQQAGEGGLAAAGASDDAHRPAGGDLHVDVVEDRAGGAVVAERHVAGGDGERARRGRRGAEVDDRRLDGEQVDDADHGAVGLLHRLQLVHQLLQRARHQQDVLEQEEGRADRDRSVGDQHRAEDEAQHEPGGDRALHRPPHLDERPLAPHRALEGAGRVLDEAPDGVHAGAVGPQVLGRREALLDPAVEPGVGAELVGRLAHGAVAAPHHDDDGGGHVHRHAGPEAPVEHARARSGCRSRAAARRRPWERRGRGSPRRT